MLPRKMLLDDLFYDFKADKDMKCDIYEKDDNYVVEAYTPGIKKDDIKIEVENGNLIIKANKKVNEEENRKYLRREISYSGKYERSFYLGDVDEENIKASFKDGVLYITIPKKQKDSVKKKIEIE